MDVDAIFSVVLSHAKASGLFENVNGHEPENPPGNGLTCAVWVDALTSALSGLDATTAYLVFKVRIYSSAISEPVDAIDPAVLHATDVLYAAYVGDFQLGGNARMVDVRGGSGVRLSAQAGYVAADGKQLRVMTITLPVIVNDAWTENP